jgi:predicted DNA-binding transcriptional regulator AlpA
MTTFIREPWKRLDISKASWYRRQKTDPTFPRLYKILGDDCRAVGADEAELEAFMRARIASRGKAA